MSLNDLPSDLEREFERYAALIRISEKAHQLMPAEIVQLVSLLKNSFDITRTLNSYVAEVKDAQKRGELLNAIGELKMALSEARSQVAEAMSVNQEQKFEIADLKREIEDLRKPQIELVLDPIERVFFSKDGQFGPFCPSCYIDRKTITTLSTWRDMIARYQCQVCGWTNKVK